MDHNKVRGPRTESRHPADNDESKRRNKRRKSKRTNKQKRADAAAHVEMKAAAVQNSLREFRADDLSEAVIWVRDYDPTLSSDKPLIRPESTAEEQPRLSKVTKRGNKSKHSKKTETPATVPTHIERPEEVTKPPAVHDRIEQRADHEPETSRERTYFWNQAETYQPNQRDVLPSVEQHQEAPEKETVIPPVKSEPVANDKAIQAQPAEPAPPIPTLESAVNPNVHSGGAAQNSQVPPISEVLAPVKQDSDNTGRRDPEPAVQSQHMEGESFDRSLPFTESSPEAVDEFEEPPAKPFETEYDFGETGFNDAATLGGVPFETAPGASSAVEYDYEPTELHERPAAHEQQPDKTEISLDKQEQLDLSKNIMVDGVSVYEMFMAKRIDEAGLKRIIADYLRGGDLRNVVKNEIIRLQLRFERDPQLRNNPIGNSGSAAKKTDVIKQRSKAMLDAGRGRDPSEKLAEFTHSAIEKSQNLMGDNPKAGRYFSIVAIVVIYLLILIAALTK